MYTIWKPNAVDGMDAANIGRTGLTSTGQFAPAYSRETGRIQLRLSTDVNDGISDTRKSDRYLTISILSDRSSLGDHS